MTINLHVHVHYPDSGVVMDSLSLILKNQETMALTLVQFQAEFDKINVATNGIAAKITALEESIKNMGLSDEDEQTLLSQLSGVAAQLEAIAAPKP